MPLKRPAVPKPENVQLGEGILVFNFNPDNWDDPESIPFGATRGGGQYNVEPTNHSIRFDGDRGEHTKGLKRRTEWNITITATALELDLEQLARIMPGTIENVTGGTSVPDYKKYRPKIDFDDNDYIKNLAYITETATGQVVAYVIENVLGDGALTAAFADKDEVVAETTFTAHFDPEKMDEVPTYVVHYDALPEV
ncbi:hypothetical protein J2S00_003076 [Caldalkalibacillus uzonensis]|uniref:Phage tail protein n=1 Tax=Caldalkalibacillus uzonensis TaxID=353224 RepID=A0ABU0CV25_9BACI|nr:hypothetical protein [Caldalkalibacillus uzonensis]MDQ0340271.1 hypothetical protein [Caldalkalibacillus uzonensis]